MGTLKNDIAINGDEETNLSTVKQPTPHGSGEPIVDMVIRDLVDRKEFGMAKYGEPLKAFNGRNPLIDAYQEALDLCCYLRQMIAEQDGKQPSNTVEVPISTESIIAMGFSNDFDTIPEEDAQDDYPELWETIGALIPSLSDAEKAKVVSLVVETCPYCHDQLNGSCTCEPDFLGEDQ